MKFNKFPLCRIVAEQKPVNRLIRANEMQELLGVSRSTLNRRIKSGMFPQPRKANGKKIGWFESDYYSWLESLS